jgi:hypothetical protein
MHSEHRIQIGGSSHPTSKTPPFVPSRLDGVRIVETEPAPPGGGTRVRVGRDHLQEHVAAKTQEMVVRAHLGVGTAIRHVDAEARAHVRHPGLERGGDDREVVECEHTSDYLMCRVRAYRTTSTPEIRSRAREQMGHAVEFSFSPASSCGGHQRPGKFLSRREAAVQYLIANSPSSMKYGATQADHNRSLGREHHVVPPFRKSRRQQCAPRVSVPRDGASGHVG